MSAGRELYDHCRDCTSFSYCARNNRCKHVERPTCGGRGVVNPLTAPASFFCTGTTDYAVCAMIRGEATVLTP